MQQQESASKLEEEVRDLKEKKGPEDIRVINKGSEHAPIGPGDYLGMVEYAIEIGHEGLENPQKEGVQVVYNDLSLTCPGHSLINDKGGSPINR